MTTRSDDAARARAALLDSAGEDEYGTWEMLAAVRTALPDVPEDERRALARTALGDLADEGLVELVRGRGLQDEAVERVGAGALDAPDAWEPAGDEPAYLSVRITPAGEDAYYALLREQSRDG